jgi:hypothetical protein
VRDLRQGEHGADRAAGDGALRHAPEARRVVLREDHAGDALDGLRAEATVAPGAGEDHPDGALADLFREGGEELIDREVRGRGGDAGGETEAAAGDDEVGVGGDDVDVAREHGGVVHRRLDGELGRPREELDEAALVGGVEVEDDDQREIELRGERGEQLRDGLDPAGGGADRRDANEGGRGRARLRRGRPGRFGVGGHRWGTNGRGNEGGRATWSAGPPG